MKWVAQAFASLAFSAFLLLPGQVVAQNIKQPDIYGCGPTAAANCVGGTEKERRRFYAGLCQRLEPGPGVVSTPRPGWGEMGGVTRQELCDALNKYDPKREWEVDSKMPIDEVAKRCEGNGKVVVLFPGTATKPGHFMTICEPPKEKEPDVFIVADPATGHTKPMKLTGPQIIIYPEPRPKP